MPGRCFCWTPTFLTPCDPCLDEKPCHVRPWGGTTVSIIIYLGHLQGRYMKNGSLDESDVIEASTEECQQLCRRFVPGKEMCLLFTLNSGSLIIIIIGRCCRPNNLWIWVKCVTYRFRGVVFAEHPTFLTPGGPCLDEKPCHVRPRGGTTAVHSQFRYMHVRRNHTHRDPNVISGARIEIGDGPNIQVWSLVRNYITFGLLFLLGTPMW